MATVVLDGCEIHYEVLGNGPAMALTPGGRLGGDAIRVTAERLAERHRVLLWDRRNTGASHLWFGSEPEQVVWADDLASLVRHLDLAPAYLAGASAGARVSYLTALRHPDVAAGLVLWSVSGGPYASQNLGYQYHTPFINEAIRAGMEGVADTAFFRERIEANPANQDRLLSTALLGSVFIGGQIFVHPPEAAVALHELVEGSELSPLPWTRDEWMDRYVGRVDGAVSELYPQLVPAVSEFVARVEAGRRSSAR